MRQAIDIDITTTTPRTEVLAGCPVCSGENSSLFFQTKDRLHGVPGEFGYHHCRSCQSVFQNPMVISDDLHLCYPSEYAPYSYDPDMTDFDAAKLESGSSFRSRFRNSIVRSVWNKPVPGLVGSLGSLAASIKSIRERAFFGLVIDECLPDSIDKHYALDVGCGAGWMVKRLRKVGWLVEGVEWDEKAASVARERTGERIWAGDFRKIGLEKEKYKLIFLSHVFEHLSDPHNALARFYELLEKEGRIVMLFPNHESLDARWFGKDWYPWDAPRHLIFPSIASMTMLAKNVGFKGVTIRTRVADHHWEHSNAYSQGLRLEELRAGMSLSQRVGLRIQKIANGLGVKIGSETVVILQKS